MTPERTAGRRSRRQTGELSLYQAWYSHYNNIPHVCTKMTTADRWTKVPAPNGCCAVDHAVHGLTSRQTRPPLGRCNARCFRHKRQYATMREHQVYLCQNAFRMIAFWLQAAAAQLGAGCGAPQLPVRLWRRGVSPPLQRRHLPPCSLAVCRAIGPAKCNACSDCRACLASLPTHRL